jgi:hypothetical protein
MVSVNALHSLTMLVAYLIDRAETRCSLGAVGHALQCAVHHAQVTSSPVDRAQIAFALPNHATSFQ